MRSILLFILLTSSFLSAKSQNVGINNPSPAEKLDVNGNINVTGTIKVNGTDGTANQVLMKNSAGILAWSDLTAYKNFTSYYIDGNFTVPVGVTKIAVELWGAGGGGNADVGGGGGGYMLAYLDVTPGANGTIDVGAGGPGSNASSATGGGASNFSIGAYNLSATGGGGGSFISATTNNVGYGGSFPVIIPGLTSYVGVKGTPGNPSKRNFVQFNATTFYEIADGADGGYAYNAFEASGKGGRIIWNITGSTNIQYITGGIDGQTPGGGGASGLHYTAGSTAGGNGGNGLVIVHY